MNAATQFFLLILAFVCVLTALVFKILARRGTLFKQKPDRRRKADHITDDLPAGTAYVLYIDSDGPPGGRRGRIWDNAERDLYQQRDRNRRIRLVR